MNLYRELHFLETNDRIDDSAGSTTGRQDPFFNSWVLDHLTVVGSFRLSVGRIHQNIHKIVIFHDF